MKKRKKKLAVGLPVYQGERYLSLALDSILSQTWGDFDLIISDNASTDATGEICRAYAARDRRIRYIRNDANVGVALNFNQAFRMSDSEYFRWAAYDDLLEPAYFQRCIERLDADAALTACHSLVWKIDADGNRVGEYPAQPRSGSPRPSERFAAIVAHEEYTAIWSVMRSSAVRRTRLHGTYRSSDYTFLAELALQGPFGYVPEYLFSVREHAAQYTGNSWSKEVCVEWWGQSHFTSKYLEAPIAYWHQAQAAMNSKLEWDQKVVCLRHLAGCTTAILGEIAGRWRRRLSNAAHGDGLRLSRPPSHHADVRMDKSSADQEEAYAVIK